MPVTWPESSWKSVERPKAHRRVPRSMQKTVCVEHGPCLWPRVWGVYRVSLFVLYSVLLSFRLFVSVLVLCCSNLCITFISHSVPSVCVSASVGQAVHVGHLCFICPFSLQLVSVVFASVVCSLIILFVCLWSQSSLVAVSFLVSVSCEEWSFVFFLAGFPCEEISNKTVSPCVCGVLCLDSTCQSHSFTVQEASSNWQVLNTFK